MIFFSFACRCRKHSSSKLLAHHLAKNYQLFHYFWKFHWKITNEQERLKWNNFQHRPKSCRLTKKSDFVVYNFAMRTLLLLRFFSTGMLTRMLHLSRFEHSFFMERRKMIIHKFSYHLKELSHCFISDSYN